MDEVERTVQDVSDDGLRRQLLRLIADLEEAFKEVIGGIDGLLTHEMFDPFRIVAADVRHEGRGDYRTVRNQTDF